MHLVCTLLINFLNNTVTVTVLKCFWIRKIIISNMMVTSSPLSIVLDRECPGCPELGSGTSRIWLWTCLDAQIRQEKETLVAQCSATPATVAATPPCRATPFQTQISVRHLRGQGGGRCDPKIFRGCSATLVLHLQDALKSRNSAATRIARHV